MVSADHRDTHVLLVDDDELVVSVLHTALVRSGFSVRDAPDAAAALRMLTIVPVKVVVLDAHMAGSTLSENLTAINALPEKPTVLVLSGASVDPALLAAHGASYLAKPIDAVDFIAAVTKAALADE